jgi:hypothetical protein
MVEERGAALRKLSFESLKALADTPTESVIVESRLATIDLIITPIADGALRVVLQAFMKARLLGGSNVAVDGFHKHRDGSVSELSSSEYNEFG